MSSYSTIRKLPANCLGKDYVIGDLHGCLDLLWRLLDEVKFDQHCDRLFSVGDLVDRGPDSLACLHLIKEPWFYAVKGNHEVMMEEFFADYRKTGRLTSLDDNTYSGFLDNGGDWVTEYYLSDKNCMTETFNEGLKLADSLPKLLVVGEGDSRFHVVHAELLNPDGYAEVDLVWTDDDIDQWLVDPDHIPCDAPAFFLWGRTLMRDHVDRASARHDKLSTTFCGHTPDAKPRQVLSHTCLDTGACYSHRDIRFGEHSLTLYDVHQQSWVSASHQRSQLVYGDSL